MAEKKRKYEAEIQALANLTLRLHMNQETEATLEALLEPVEPKVILESEIARKKDLVLRLIQRIKNV